MVDPDDSDFEPIEPQSVRLSSVRNAELEACLQENPDDPDALSVYADWLTSQGDVRGRLIGVQLARTKNPGDDDLERLERRILHDHARALLGPLESHKVVRSGADYLPSFRWKNGFLRAARLWRPAEQPTLPDLLHMLFDHPAGCVVEHIVLSQTWWGDSVGYEDAVKVLASRAPKTFKSLQLAESPDAVPGNVARALRLPGLKRFRVQYQPLELGDVGISQLEELAIDVSGPTFSILESFERAAWPELRSLSVSSDMLPALKPVLDRGAAPKLERITIVGATNDVISALARSGVLSQLREIELWWVRELEKLAEFAERFRAVPKILLQRTGPWSNTPMGTRLREELPNLTAFTATKEPDALDR